MDSNHWTGSDDRDALAPDYEQADYCAECGEHLDDPCLDACLCKWCGEKRARLAALRTLDVMPEDAA